MNGANGELRPAFKTADECRDWLARTPLTNPVQGLSLLLRQLNLLNRDELDVAERIAILELLRKPLLLVQEDGSRRFVGKPLPLVPPEQAAFDAALAVWQSLLAGYLRCIETLGEDQDRLPLLAQRAIATLAAAEFDTCRAGFRQGPEQWQTLHGLYAAAEAAGVADSPVEDQARQGKTPSSVAAVYAEMLLLQAFGPHELPLRHLQWVARWARRWSAKVVVATSPPPLEKSVPLCVDLASSEPAGYRPAAGSGARWLDTDGVRQSLKKRLLLLDQGRAPADLQLGDDCVQPACGQVLRHAYQCWCKGGFARRTERPGGTRRCELVLGVEAIHYYLSGRTPFRQPSFSDDDALRRERERLATFGRVPQVSMDGYERQQGYRIEPWQLTDESPTGIQVTRSLADDGGRVAQGQLVAVRREDAQHFLLGSVRWAMADSDGSLQAGIQLIPGRPEPVAAFAIDVTGIREAYRQAFLLPPIEALGSVASVVLPPGHFRGGRIVDLAGAPIVRIRVVKLLDRGIDFDRASYEPVD